MNYTFSLCLRGTILPERIFPSLPHFTNVQNTTHTSKGRFIKGNPGVSVPCLCHFSHQYFSQKAEQQCVAVGSSPVMHKQWISNRHIVPRLAGTFLFPYQWYRGAGGTNHLGHRVPGSPLPPPPSAPLSISSFSLMTSWGSSKPCSLCSFGLTAAERGQDLPNFCVSAAPAPKEGGIARSRQVTGKALVCMCVSQKLLSTQRESFGWWWEREEEGEGFLLPLSIHSSYRQLEQAFLLPDDLGKLVTHRGSRSCIGFSISVFDNTCILADFKYSSGKRVSISSEKAVTLKEFWLLFKD